MTVASATAKSGPYTGNGSQTVFAYGFKVFANTELRVIRTSIAGADTILTLATDYTVSGVGADGGGNVTCTTAPATGEKITILRNVPLTQLTDLRQQGGFYPEVHERVFDRLAMAVQQVNEKVERSIKVSPSAATSPDDLLASIAASEANAAASASSAASSAATAVSAASTVGVPSLGVFTGNGSQTVFTLPATPPSTNAIMVFVGGVHQERTKFSYVGTTLTFVTAPPNGAPIQVVIGAPLNSTAFTNTVGTNEMQDAAVTARKESDDAWSSVASAATVDLGAVNSRNALITGTTTITSFGNTGGEGRVIRVRFSGALTLTHNATSLILPSGANITTAAGDTAEFVKESGTGNWRCTDYQRASGQAVVAPVAIFSAAYTSSDQTITSAGLLTLAHSLGGAPTLVFCQVVCATAEHNYSIGDVVFWYSAQSNASGSFGAAVLADATNVSVRFGAAASPFALPDKTTGIVQPLTNANWRLRVRAWR
ncbi:MAG: hypothetical protein ING29_13055 [Azospirillum sp.]|nr:hypothetical protein [Azospirillum sp.]